MHSLHPKPVTPSTLSTEMKPFNLDKHTSGMLSLTCVHPCFMLLLFFSTAETQNYDMALLMHLLVLMSKFPVQKLIVSRRIKTEQSRAPSMFCLVIALVRGFQDISFMAAPVLTFPQDNRDQLILLLIEVSEQKLFDELFILKQFCTICIFLSQVISAQGKTKQHSASKLGRVSKITQETQCVWVCTSNVGVCDCVGAFVWTAVLDRHHNSGVLLYYLLQFLSYV